ncbi:hypothetical protein V2J09_017794 [Rumex salicifolius]
MERYMKISTAYLKYRYRPEGVDAIGLPNTHVTEVIEGNGRKSTINHFLNGQVKKFKFENNLFVNGPYLST